ncbi:MAG: Tfx family DNA-binding protein [Nitrososphaerota archaeon]|nr:Tfx family DNA-binding protein [Candidatus Bathyarchaeota archaeon]MDW8023692.1 Tfx family DNA-binding protein [Nitrososphaerota archaeon]
MPRKYGFFTDLQYKVLQLRIRKGLSHAEIAAMLGTTRENIVIMEARARRNLRLAEETIQAYRSLISVANVEVEAGTHLVDVPSMLVKAGDKLGIKLRMNFTRIYDEIKFKAADCIDGARVVKPFTIAIFSDGDIEVISKRI